METFSHIPFRKVFSQSPHDFFLFAELLTLISCKHSVPTVFYCQWYAEMICWNKSEHTLSPKSVFLKLSMPYNHLEALLKQTADPCPQSFWFGRSRRGQTTFISNKSLVEMRLLVQGTHFENHNTIFPLLCISSSALGPHFPLHSNL